MDIYEFFIRLSMVDGSKLAKIKNIKFSLNHKIDANQLLNQLGFSQEQQKSFYNTSHKIIDSVFSWLSVKNHSLITYTDANYPPLLKQINSAPLLLFVIGDPSLLLTPQIAMVGSRNFSEYGAQWGRYFASELAANGLTVTSGLALGIDAICHRGALDSSGKTIAVLGSGLSKITPRSHYQLANDILSMQGTLVSEFFPDQTARPEYFPRRNRIINGLSLGTLIVEASKKSGSLITARYALEQNRDVFALPGEINNQHYEGTHWLIQQGAYLVTKPTDILEHLNGGLHWLPNYDTLSDEGNPKPINDELNNEKLTAFPHPEILAIIHHQPIPVDIIAEKLAQPVSVVSIKLLDLELTGAIKTVTGGYIRNHL